MTALDDYSGPFDSTFALNRLSRATPGRCAVFRAKPLG